MIKPFVVMSKYVGETDWIRDYTTEYQIYDKSTNPLGYRSIRIPNVGFNLYAYFTYIIEHYENLPELVMFCKNNLIGRHVSKAYFESVMNNEFFTPMVDKTMIRMEMPGSYWDGGYKEKNNWNMYFNLLYVRNINEFLDFVYEKYPYPEYIRFAPGANYIVPKGQLLRLPKELYQEMRIMVEHHQLSGESHIIERCLDTLWTSGFKIREQRFIKTL